MKFDEKYTRESFSQFLANFLPEDYAEHVKDLAHIDSCKIIREAYELGHSPSLNLHVLEMSHERETDPRIAIATDAFRILATYQIDKALVIFKSDNSSNYRFSYLSISLDVNEKNKITRSYSNARRFSFYLGVEAKTKTPTQQLIKRGRVKNGQDLLERFSLEVVNKQFYLELAKHFDALIDEHSKLLALPSRSDQNARKNFAMRLIGRIMFCWFLKQKRSVNDRALIPDDLLSVKAVKQDYYHNVLEPLFFGILNTQIDARDIRGEPYDSVPYLNGGLFSAQHDDYYDIDRELLVSKHLNTLNVAEDWFRDFFSLLETYNFTIDENTVFDQELSVDPEMLGRIFENLLAEINPETGGSERKRTGSYYTPRQIVEYMVDRSLVEHLRIKTGIDNKKLETLLSYDLNDDVANPLTDIEKQKIIDVIDSLKLLDPACGSGAFPIGALQKIVWVLNRVDPDCTLWLEKKLAKVPEIYKQKIINESKENPFDYIRKLDIIKNSIFGVDIQPIAVEISRLRCFLTLVVESEVNDTKQNRGIEPLPNLDFKFVCANTLIPPPEEGSGQHQLFADDFQLKLSAAIDKYFSSSGANKTSASNEIHRLIDSKVDEKLKHIESLVSVHDERYKAALAKTNEKAINASTRIIKLWSSYKSLFENKPVDFFDPKYFFPSVKDGFDIVIGNPPYVKKEHLKKNDIDELEKVFAEQINSKPKHWSDDLYVHFIFKGLELAKEDGILTYVTNDSFIGLSSKERVRRLMLANDLKQIVRCPADTFDATIYVAVFLLRKGLSVNSTYQTGYFKPTSFEYQYLGDVTRNLLNALPGKRLIFANPLAKIFERLATDKRVKDYLVILDTGIHSGNVRNKIFFAENITGRLDRLIQGKQIDRWGIFWDAPGAKYKYCDIHYIPSTQKGIGRGGKQSKLDEWWHMGDVTNHHQPERLLMRQTEDDLVVAYQNEQQTGRLYTDNTLFTIFPKDKAISLKYAMAILNSRFLNALYHFLSQEEGKTLAQVKVKLVEELPFRVVDQGTVVKIVDKIIGLTSSETYLQDNQKQTQVLEYEKEIDQLVYRFFDLSPTEVAIIEETSK